MTTGTVFVAVPCNHLPKIRASKYSAGYVQISKMLDESVTSP